MRVLLCLLGALALSACSSPAPPRFFRPPHEVPTAAPLTSRTLALGPTTSGQHLGDRIMWRRSDVEVGFYDQERWTQPPARFVDQALSDALFVARGLRRVERGGLALSVSLEAFEEVLLPKHEARVELRVLLVDGEGAALLERSVLATRPVASEDAEAMVRALGLALDAAIEELADAIQAAAIRG
ncbi:MAG: membrane integrity-associated transporter subunit PqiC [Planctomycetes bacterium]|nr:membrane integrity-associated transporter subunit PqiC [Planctomycetota bacterium]